MERPKTAPAKSQEGPTDDGSHVKVVVRVRPFSSEEKQREKLAAFTARGHSEITTTQAQKRVQKSYHFDQVFGENTQQQELFEAIGAPVVDEVLKGFNCTIFAYGQTGTGKTFTMEGAKNSAEFAGVVPRSVSRIFQYLQTMNATDYTVRVSCLELYNEELMDLVSTSHDARLRLLEDPQKGVVVSGIEERTVTNADDIYAILEQAQAKRQTAATLMNAHSSRSHSVFTVRIFMKESTGDGEDLIRTGTLNLVDLAGSENVKRSGAAGARGKEAGMINQSLLTLGRVISALVENQPHIPYRESKLTRLLQESLGGRTKTCIIATISPSVHGVEETLSTLDYACRAKNIKNKPEVNQTMSKKVLVRELNKRIACLEEELQAQREQNGVYLPATRLAEMEQQIALGSSKGEELSALLDKHKEELAQTQELFTKCAAELEASVAAHQETSANLEKTEGVLKKTTTKLHDTTSKLEDTTVVLTERTATGKELHKTGGHLLQTSNALVSDVHGLFSKIERKEKLVAENKDTARAFEEDLQSQIHAAREGLHKFREGQVASHKALQQAVATFVVMKGEELHRLRSDVDAIRVLVDTAAVGAKEGAKAAAEHNTEQLEASVELARKHSNTLGTDLTMWERGMAAEAEAWGKAVDVSGSELVRWSKDMRGAIDGAREAADTFARDQCTALDAVDAALRSIAAAHNDAADAQRVSLAAAVNAQEALAAKERAKLTEAFNQLMEESFARQVGALGAAVSFASNEIQASADVTSSAVDEACGALVETKKLASNYAVAANTAAENANTQADAGTAMHQSSLSCGKKAMDEVVGLARTASESVADAASQHLEQATELAATGREGAERYRISSERAMEELKSRVDSAVDEAQQAVGTTASTTDDFGTSTSSKVNTCTEALEQFHIAQTAQLGVVSDARIALRDYNPTGETPDKREVVLPAMIPRLRPDDEILAEHKGRKGLLTMSAPKPPMSPSPAGSGGVTPMSPLTNLTALRSPATKAFSEASPALGNEENVHANIAANMNTTRSPLATLPQTPV